MDITIRSKVTNLTGSMWINKDDSGQEVAGKKNIQVNMEHGYSFRAQEGDDLFSDISDYVRIGMELEVKCSGITPVQYETSQTTDSGGEVAVKRFFMNLNDVELVDIKEPVRNEKFSGLQKKDPLVFAHHESNRSFGRRGKKPSAPQDETGGTEDETVNY